ncbi:STE3-type pheromone receptor [Agaricus bisporus var. bisporus H97]|uniref:STE3-type pheromone receptor n=1 Tax=Agaricus bisporus var. bisporus (strain H97 / ATCC MYA-4626 / FGSC 10389) TaxID=936046 RepID=UPI00029F5443|nr:STE3-type pheromone receptor [Agaricus bisporus var. bisporus H97]EKV43332.1 STE3-type pheromone receptor [Agaricus bisporus var. bisporus H97]
MSYPNWVFSLFSFLGFTLVCIPFPWHLEAWNTGTCLYMAWTGIACLNQFINSVVWNKDAINYAPVWCDISSRLIIGTSVAIPAASLCITRRLYLIASVRSVNITRADKHRQVYFDLALGLGLPILEMVLQIISEGHRFNIWQEVGCYPYTYNTWVAIVLVSFPPIVIGLVSGVYAALSIRAFYKTRAQSKAILSVYSNLTPGRYLRLIALASCEILCTVPLGAYALYLNLASDAMHPWISWQDTHSGYSRVDQTPSLIWRSIPLQQSSLELSRWLVVVCAIIFFAFFGFADEARKNYRSAASSVAKFVGVATTSASSGTAISSSQISKSGIEIGFNKKYGHSSSNLSFSDKSSLKGDDGISKPSVIEEKKDRSFAGVFGKKKFNEEVFKPTFHYDDLVLPDIGGTLDDKVSYEISTVPSSPTSSLSTTELGASHLGVDGEDKFSPPSISEERRRHSHDMV